MARAVLLTATAVREEFLHPSSGANFFPSRPRMFANIILNAHVGGSPAADGPAAP
jgi:hypothetical protein